MKIEKKSTLVLCVLFVCGLMIADLFVGCAAISKALGLQGQNTVTVNGTNTIVVPPGTAVVPAPSP